MTNEFELNDLSDFYGDELGAENWNYAGNGIVRVIFQQIEGAFVAYVQASEVSVNPILFDTLLDTEGRLWYVKSDYEFKRYDEYRMHITAKPPLQAVVQTPAFSNEDDAGFETSYTDGVAQFAFLDPFAGDVAVFADVLESHTQITVKILYSGLFTVNNRIKIGSRILYVQNVINHNEFNKELQLACYELDTVNYEVADVSPLDPVLLDMINFYEMPEGDLGKDTQENDDLINTDVTHIDVPPQGDMADFNGISAFLGGLPVRVAAQAGTWAFVVETTDVTSDQIFLGDSASANNLIQSNSASNIFVRFSSAGSTKNYALVSPLVNNTRFHFAMTKTASSGVRIYITGVESSSGIQTVTGDAIFPNIGARTVPSFNKFLSGKVTNFRRWNYDLTAAQILIVSNHDLK